MTPKVMALLKKDLKSAKMPKHDKLMMWSISTLMFNGGFRGGEILCNNSKNFDPSSCLLGQDINLRTATIKGEKTQFLEVKLKLEKCDRSDKLNIIDVYASQGESCPVRAWKKWQCVTNTFPTLPAYRNTKGDNFTTKDFNAYLRAFNSKYLNIPGRSLSCHSFRAGLATMLGQIGYTDQEIQLSGRWNSRAFLAYIKLPRTQRLKMAREIGALNL